MMQVDFGTYLPEDVLTKVDRMSMAHSIESRVPLLDHPLIEFALRLPLGLKLREGQRKYLLKRVAARLLPPALLDAEEAGLWRAARRVVPGQAARRVPGRAALALRPPARLLCSPRDPAPPGRTPFRTPGP